MDGSTVLFSGTVGADRTVTFQASTAAASGKAIVAAYGGDVNFSASSSSAVTQTVAVKSGCSSASDTTGGLLLLIGLFALIARSSKSKVNRAV
jgi:MYXO-CTERM domain-containing protein